MAFKCTEFMPFECVPYAFLQKHNLAVFGEETWIDLSTGTGVKCTQGF
jgi:hypothetical protein